MPDLGGELVIVGPGRAGLALAAALLRAGVVPRIHLRGRRTSLEETELVAFSGLPLSYAPGYELPGGAKIGGIIVAVPDAAIPAVAERLALSGGGGTLPPALHLSGAGGVELLEFWRVRGGSVGSLHPLVSLTGPASADRLRGAWFAIEGEGEAETLARDIVAALEGRVLQLSPNQKPLYHAAAVMASNFVVALLGEAEGWMVRAGVPEEAARAALTELAAGAVDHVARLGPTQALTGPIVRGDADTVASHLAQLSPRERHLYSVLAESALELARERGLADAAVQDLARLIRFTE